MKDKPPTEYETPPNHSLALALVATLCGNTHSIIATRLLWGLEVTRGSFAVGLP